MFSTFTHNECIGVTNEKKWTVFKIDWKKNWLSQWNNRNGLLAGSARLLSYYSRFRCVYSMTWTFETASQSVARGVLWFMLFTRNQHLIDAWLKSNEDKKKSNEIQLEFFKFIYNFFLEKKYNSMKKIIAIKNFHCW